MTRTANFQKAQVNTVFISVRGTDQLSHDVTRHSAARRAGKGAASTHAPTSAGEPRARSPRRPLPAAHRRHRAGDRGGRSETGPDPPPPPPPAAGLGRAAVSGASVRGGRSTRPRPRQELLPFPRAGRKGPTVKNANGEAEDEPQRRPRGARNGHPNTRTKKLQPRGAAERKPAAASAALTGRALPARARRGQRRCGRSSHRDQLPIMAGSRLTFVRAVPAERSLALSAPRSLPLAVSAAPSAPAAACPLRPVRWKRRKQRRNGLFLPPSFSPSPPQIAGPPREEGSGALLARCPGDAAPPGRCRWMTRVPSVRLSPAWTVGLWTNPWVTCKPRQT